MEVREIIGFIHHLRIKLWHHDYCMRGGSKIGFPSMARAIVFGDERLLVKLGRNTLPIEIES